MRTACIFAMMLLISIPTFSVAQDTLTVPGKSDQVKDSMQLGDLYVEGLGKVSFVVRREQQQLVIQAVGPDGKTVGRAETVAGINETPVYVSTSKGLKKLLIRWGTRNNEVHDMKKQN